jgi:hypothetical protein
MKKIMLAVVCVGLMAGTVFGSPVISFSPAGDSPGRWNYDGINTLSFPQSIVVAQGAGSTSDTLATSGARVYIPNLVVGDLPSGPYTVNPASSEFEIKSADGLTTYLTGTLVPGDLVPVGTSALLYTEFNADITNVVVNNTIGSTALAMIASSNQPLDLNLGLSASQYFGSMLKDGQTGTGSFSGVLDITPEPCTLLLLGLGAAVVRKRR